MARQEAEAHPIRARPARVAVVVPVLRATEPAALLATVQSALDQTVLSQEILPRTARERGTAGQDPRDAHEAGEREAGPREAGAGGAGSRDAGALEKDAREAGSRDAGAPETGTREAGEREAGPHEAGALDRTRADLDLLLLFAADADPAIAAHLPAEAPLRRDGAAATTLGALLDEALDQTGAEWIHFVLPGDRLAPTALARSLACASERPGLAAVFGRFEVVDADGVPKPAPAELAPAARPVAAAETLLADLVESNAFPLGAALLRREDARELGGFDATFSSRPEHDLWLRLVAGRAVDVAGEPLVRLRWPRAGFDRDVDRAEHARALLRALRGGGLESFVRALGGGERDDRRHQSIARAELARRLERTGLPALRPFVQRLVRESRAAGGAFPADAPFAELGSLLPELARPEGWFPPSLPERSARPSASGATARSADGSSASGTRPSARGLAASPDGDGDPLRESSVEGGAFPPLHETSVAGGAPSPLHGASFAAGPLSPPHEAALAGGAFPPLVRIALATRTSADLERAAPLLAAARALREAGVELVVVHARSRDGDAVLPALPVPVEILRHEGSRAEIAAVLARGAVALVVADESHPVASVARETGVAVRTAPLEAPADGEAATALARTLLRDALRSGDARAHASALAREAWAAVRARDAAEAEEATLGALLAALGEAGVAAARPGGEVRAGEALSARLAEARRDAEALRRIAGTARGLAARTLDKLRVGARVRAALAGREAAPASANGAAVVSLDVAAAERFLEAASRAASARETTLWVVYTTDPYSETLGQRSTWLARELVRRGDAVVFFYWRWHLSDAIAEAPHANLLPVPIDQFFRLQKPLMDLAAPGLRKVFLIEFPDAYLFEQIDLANAHGFTTVYDCVDDWEEFARAGHAHWYDPAVEAHLARHADAVVATHPRLVEHLAGMGREPDTVALVPNGVDVGSLRRSAAAEASAGGAPARGAAATDATGKGDATGKADATGKTDVAGKTDATGARGGGQIVVGYFGHLTPAWFDWDLVREAAAARPEWRFEIFGPGAPAELALPPNVVVPGPVPHAELAERTRSWRVGVVPFRPGPLARAVDPIKLYEYLALGLPAVVVDMWHLESVPGVVCCERSGFVAAIERALGAPRDEPAVARFLEASGWAKRTEALLEALARAADAARDDLMKAV